MATAFLARLYAKSVPDSRSLPDVPDKVRAEVAELKGYESGMTKAELVEWAPGVGVDLTSSMTKAEMLAALGLA